ncbi:MAG: stage II sporulation protein R [Clostridiales bacterium]|jgi:stage II sporulation protein R|nr:stage II sporulation protein R [Clostridiales bacterium]
MNAIRNWYAKERKILGLSILCGAIFTVCIGWFTKAYSESAQEEIAEGVIRFHVLANSDDPADQTLKNQVRDGILAAFRDDLSASHSRAETRAFLKGHLDEIRECAENIICENGYVYPAAVSLARDFFPTKNYGDITFPPGVYEALRVVIGGGEGRNWWCVMFPPLCYVDVTKGQTSNEAKTELKEAVGPQKYELLSDTEREQNITVKVKFKVVEWWQNLFHQREKPKKKSENNDAYIVLVPDKPDKIGNK